MENVKRILKNVFGFILFCVVLLMFVIDRFILMFLPHVESQPIQKVYMNAEKMKPIFSRVFTIVIVILIYKLIVSLW